jgi:cyclopropane fatty-acyl-phospholipid synthase-like methyltransferase
MKYIKTGKYDKQFLLDNMMGPNSIKIVEELTTGLLLNPGMRVLDMGCGNGLSSVFLAKEFGVQVFAHDLWVSATENYNRFKSFNLDNLIIPVHGDALEMPYADEYFDAVICINAYYYFGMNQCYMDDKLAPLVKKDGIIALAFSGLKKEYDKIPEEFLHSWISDNFDTWHSCDWWREFFSKSKMITNVSVAEMQGFDECWNDWLACENEDARSNRKVMQAGAGKYMNLISIIARRN